MFERFRKYHKLVIVMATICAAFGVLWWRYYHVNSFYFAYQRGEYRKAMGQIWAGSGISYVDLEKAGVKKVDSAQAILPSPKAFDLRFNKQGKIYDFSGWGFETVLAVSEKNNENKPATIIDIERRNVETIDKSGASKSQIKYYKKFAVQYMYGVEKKLYKYLDRHPCLRILKMIPLYEYFQKK